MKDEVLQLLQHTFEEVLETLRDELLRRKRYKRCGTSKLYRYGYRMRKFLETSWGTISRVRVPRLKSPQGEACLWARGERRLWRIAEELLFSFGQGTSLRSLQVHLEGLHLPGDSVSTLGRVIREKVQELKARRSRPLYPRAYQALVLDGGVGEILKGGKERGTACGPGSANRWKLRGSGLGGYCFGESPFWEKLLHRLSQRGLQEVELVVADGARGVWEALEG